MLKEKIDKLIGEARLNKEPKKVLVYQAIKNEFLRFTTAKNAKPLDDAAEINILRKMIKERRDAAAMFIEGKRQDLANAFKEVDYQIARADSLEAELNYYKAINDPNGMNSNQALFLWNQVLETKRALERFE